MQNRPAPFVILFILLFTVTVSGQKLVNSPYSRFNLGTFEPTATNRSLAMGGISIASRDNSSFSFSNPASYSAIDTNSFVFDFGIDYGMNYLNASGSKYHSDDFNFDHLIMGFPLAKGLGISTGIINVTNGYYKISQSIKEGDSDYDPIAGAYTATHLGSGGLTGFFLGSGLNVMKNLSIGVNLNVLFGSIDRTNDFFFDDVDNMYHNTELEKLKVSGINYDLGAQYSIQLKEKYFITLGGAYTFGKNYKTDYESIIFRYTAYGNQDTIASTTDNITKTFIPATIKAGISFGKKDKFSIGLDYNQSAWSTGIIPESSGHLGDTRNFLFGAEFIPDKFANYGFLKRLEYRIGAHTGDSYLVLNGTQVKESGISAGFGMPMRKSYSKANFYIDLTKRSATGYHSETYITFGASLNLYDWWFVKRKYD